MTGPERLMFDVRRLGMRTNFAWALAGNAVYGASLWLSLVILAKLTSPEDVGRYALALAICTPITVFSALNLAVVQVTDAREEHRFGNLLALQMSMSVLGFLAILAVALVGGYDLTQTWLIVVVGAGQTVVVVRAPFIAISQKQERMDLVARSKTLLGLGSLAALASVVYVTRDVLSGVAAMQVVKLGVLLIWDLPVARRVVRHQLSRSPSEYLSPSFQPRVMASLAWLALPLGVTAVVTSLHTNVPRYYISHFMGEAPLGFFAAITAVTVAGLTIMQAGSTAVLPRLSRRFLDDVDSFARLLLMLIGVGAALGAGGILVAWLFGGPLLTLLYTPDYAAYSSEFTLAMVYGAVLYVAVALRHGMLAMRRFKVWLLVALSSLCITSILAVLLVPRLGLTGALLAWIVSGLVECVLALIVVALGMASRRRLAAEARDFEGPPAAEAMVEGAP